MADEMTTPREPEGAEPMAHEIVKDGWCYIHRAYCMKLVEEQNAALEKERDAAREATLREVFRAACPMCRGLWAGFDSQRTQVKSVAPYWIHLKDGSEDHAERCYVPPALAALSSPSSSAAKPEAR